MSYPPWYDVCMMIERDAAWKSGGYLACCISSDLSTSNHTKHSKSKMGYGACGYTANYAHITNLRVPST